MRGVTVQRYVVQGTERQMRARVRIARDAGHDQGCALAFAARLVSAYPPARLSAVLGPCLREQRYRRRSFGLALLKLRRPA